MNKFYGEMVYPSIVMNKEKESTSLCTGYSIQQLLYYFFQLGRIQYENTVITENVFRSTWILINELVDLNIFKNK